MMIDLTLRIGQGEKTVRYGFGREVDDMFVAQIGHVWGNRI